MRIKPKPVVAGQKVELTIQGLTVRRPNGEPHKVVYDWRARGHTYRKEAARFRSPTGEKGTYFKFTQPHWVDPGPATLCIEANLWQDNLGDRRVICEDVRVKDR